MDLPNAAYGEAKSFKQAEQGAPMSALGGMPTPTGPPAAPGPGGPPGGTPASGGMDLPVGLGEPTQRPDEPVTHGADAGEGPGSASLGLMSPAAQQHQDGMSVLQSMIAQSPDNPTLQWLSEAMGRGF